MGRCVLAFKMFLKVLFDAEAAKRIQTASDNTPSTKIEEPKPAPVKTPVIPTRSEALTLLETLQREARLIDFLKEDLSEYQDAQVGAAVREVHRGCQGVLARCFQIDSSIDVEEGLPYEVTAETNPAQVRLIGNVVETRPITGTLVHSGWKVSKCELPKWTGKSEDETIIAPAEVEIS
ncbi:DUF2760 domain-containing protein [bacterium]|jgi:hypothetical protein|nr:DUF2760 domain-containing protein [Planctomicrobium sp.]MDB4731275.1 DUF2760 domain-containing protein [bacterium]